MRQTLNLKEGKMIISHKHKFIFAKNKKVGSSSTEIFLKDFLNPKVDVWFGEQGYGNDEYYTGYNMTEHKDPHTSIHQILDERNKNYFKCVVERNPWDQYISMYDYQIAQGHVPYEPKRFFDFNYNIYTLDGNLLVEQVLRYENLKQEIVIFCERFNLNFDNNKWDKMNYKRQTRKHKTREFYEKRPELFEQVNEAARLHIDYLGYKFT